MKRYQIKEVREHQNNAGTKANADVADVASRMGFEEYLIHMKDPGSFTGTNLVNKGMRWLIRQNCYVREWAACPSAVETGSVMLLQHPFHSPQIGRERALMRLKQNGVRFICMVHDVEKLRGILYNNYYKEEFGFMMKIADVLIVHNDVMKRYFVRRGFPEDRIVVLGIFDYLMDEPEPPKLPEFSKSITVAGNLDTAKCGYIGYLPEIAPVKAILYGMGFDERMRSSNIDYRGELAPEEVPSRMTEGFGLIWDGTDIDGCQGPSGRYLRYNNPHKLSLYLASGLPVVIWSKAAEAKFVRRHHVGITVDSLRDLANLIEAVTPEEYRAMAENAIPIARKLRRGAYTEHALHEALAIAQAR